jgi:hypothetical protein
MTLILPIMKRTHLFFAAVVLASAGHLAHALALGPDEFAAAQQLTCVLAQDSLGYLSESEYDELVDEVLGSYEETDGDVIYAKALGYFDGLMFGIPERDANQINDRLRNFVQSQSCTRVVGVSYSL